MSLSLKYNIMLKKKKKVNLGDIGNPVYCTLESICM